jgi:hypothetical protein
MTKRTTPAERRARLVAALRAPLPARFEWDFGTVYEKRGCGTVGCALGLAQILWPRSIDADVTPEERVARFFGITEEDADRVFYAVGNPYGRYISNVTPAMVADELEKVGG